MKRCCVILLCVLMVAGLIGCAGNGDSGSGSGTMRFGFGRRDITPSGSVPLDGFGNSNVRYSNNVLDPLYATCIAFTDAQDNTALIFTVDLISMKDGTADLIKQSVYKSTGIPMENMFISATHTHSSPGSDQTAIQTKVVDGATKAAELAMEDRSAGKLYAGTVKTEKLNAVRHYVNSDGTVAGNGFGTYKEIVGHTTEADRDMQLIKIEREDKAPIIMVNFQAHPTLTGGFDCYDISADFVGAARMYIEEQMECSFAYFTAAAGNLNARSKIEEENITTNTIYFTQGKTLADVVMKNLDNLTEMTLGEVKSKELKFTYKANHADADKLQYCSLVTEAFEKGGSTLATEVGLPYGLESVSHARAIMVRESQLGDTHEMNIGAITIGDLGFIAAPYEMFDTQGMYIKENSPMAMTVVLTLCNGHEGYIPSEVAYTYGLSGAYEAYASKFAKGAGEKLALTYVEMLKELNNG